MTLRHALPAGAVLGVAVLVLGAIGHAAAPLLSPPVLLAATLLVLWPCRAEAAVRRMMWVGVAFVALWFFEEQGIVLIPVLLAVLAAYFFSPAVEALEQRRHVPRWLSALVIVVLLCALVAGVAVTALPPVAGNTEEVAKGVQGIVAGGKQWLESNAASPEARSMGVQRHELVAQVEGLIHQEAEGFVLSLVGTLEGFLDRLPAVPGYLLNILVFPVVLFFLLRDLPWFFQRLLGLVPAARQEAVLTVARRIDAIIGRYLRGAIVVALIQGGISATGLWLIGVRYPLLLGAMTAVLDFVPYLGLAISLVVSIMVAAVSGGVLAGKALLIIAMYLSQKLLEATVLAPKIIGPQVGLHPVLLILALVLFGHFSGLAGLLVAVPLGALILAVVRRWSDEPTFTRVAPEGS